MGAATRAATRPATHQGPNDEIVIPAEPDVGQSSGQVAQDDRSGGDEEEDDAERSRPRPSVRDGEVGFRGKLRLETAAVHGGNAQWLNADKRRVKEREYGKAPNSGVKSACTQTSPGLDMND